MWLHCSKHFVIVTYLWFDTGVITLGTFVRHLVSPPTSCYTMGGSCLIYHIPEELVVRLQSPGLPNTQLLPGICIHCWCHITGVGSPAILVVVFMWSEYYFPLWRLGNCITLTFHWSGIPVVRENIMPSCSICFVATTRLTAEGSQHLEDCQQHTPSPCRKQLHSYLHNLIYFSLTKSTATCGN